MQYYYTLLVAGPDQILDRFKGASSVWNFGGHRKKVPSVVLMKIIVITQVPFVPRSYWHF